ncbi:patellin-4 [Pyrus ussuriensis x Pyrus communis]|uniref:Patellin-4 n=1 Tax=Pyrus ussuriensis x Pyrus communis TaxID=2448454 RepID=A0A5N5FQ26_9ROSA|nr:patellin-4 [Pyrus ussuriensis x Pyrus communis]
MTAEETQVAEVVVVPQEEAEKVVCENEKVVEGDDKVKEVDEAESKPKAVEKSSSYKEESNYLSDLKEFEKKALSELKSKLEEAILGNIIFKEKEPKKEEEKKEEKKVAEEEKKEDTAEEGEKTEEAVKTEEEEKNEEKPEEECEKKTEEVAEENEKMAEEGEEAKKPEDGCEVVDKDISLWGVPLFPSKGFEGTDVVLLKFLRAREFKVNEAFEMLKKTLQWRKESKIDSILDEDVCADLSSAAYLNGVDREGHPVCYNIFGVFDNEELYQKTFGNEEKRGQFLRWRLQLMEKSVQKLDLRPGGVTSLLQINDLKNSPGPVKKELRIATKQAVGLLQDNYPELVAKNIFINVPFWYYALNALLSPFLTQRTKSKFVVARPAKVTETLLKYIPAQEIPAQYGGFKRDNDKEFSAEDGAVSELILRAGSTGTIQIDVAEVGSTLVWDLTVLGWEVNYKEEFVPTDEGSYTIIVQKKKKMGSNEGPIRNTFRSNEPGKVVLTIENNSSKKKRVLYRYKANKCSTF